MTVSTPPHGLQKVFTPDLPQHYYVPSVEWSGGRVAERADHSSQLAPPLHTHPYVQYVSHIIRTSPRPRVTSSCDRALILFPPMHMHRLWIGTELRRRRELSDSLAFTAVPSARSCDAQCPPPAYGSPSEWGLDVVVKGLLPGRMRTRLRLRRRVASTAGRLSGAAVRRLGGTGTGRWIWKSGTGPHRACDPRRRGGRASSPPRRSPGARVLGGRGV